MVGGEYCSVFADKSLLPKMAVVSIQSHRALVDICTHAELLAGSVDTLVASPALLAPLAAQHVALQPLVGNIVTPAAAAPAQQGGNRQDKLGYVTKI